MQNISVTVLSSLTAAPRPLHLYPHHVNNNFWRSCKMNCYTQAVLCPALPPGDADGRGDEL